MSYMLFLGGFRPLNFFMTDSTDHVTGKTGLTPTVTIRKVGGSFASPAGAVSEIANGWYTVAGNATDCNTAGPLLLHATATGADPTDTVYDVVGFNPDVASLPNAAAGAAGGLPILGTNATAISFTGGMTISNASGSALTLSSSGSNGNGLAASGNGTGDGIAATGGATGRGIHAVGGATSGAGIRAEGTAGNSSALELAGQGSAHGLSTTGGATGNGISAVGGATSGSAIKATGTAGNAIALELVGQGSAAGLKTTGGATGNGATFTGGATSGHGLQATATAGSNEIDADITGTLSAVATGVQTAIAGKVWDEATSGHVTAGSFGAQLQAPNSGTAQAGAATTITLAAGASAVNDFYKNCGVYILSGIGAGQFRFISGYVGATKVATVATWGTNPDATSVYTLIPFGAIAGATAPTASENAIAVWEEARSSHTTAGSFGQYFQTVFRGGTAQAGTTSSITLDSGASATNDLYKYGIISIIGGTGAGQSRQCNGYTGSSKVATVGVNWTVAPDSTSVFLVMPLGVDAATVAAIASAVWEETRAAHATAGTMGEYVTADAQRIGGSSTSGTNAKNAFDGATGYGFTGCTMPTTTNVTNSVTATATLADGAHGGSSFTLTGKSIALTNSDAGGIALDIVGSGTGNSHAMRLQSTNGHGLAAGSTNGNAINAASSAAEGVKLSGGTNKEGLLAVGNGTASDIKGNINGTITSVTGAVGSVTGAVGSVTGAVGSVTGNVGGNVTGSVGSLATQAATDVKTQVVAALATDTYAEPTTAPAATASLKDKIGYMHALSRNKITQTATTFSLRNDADSGNIATATVSDDSTTAVMGEVG